MTRKKAVSPRHISPRARARDYRDDDTSYKGEYTASGRPRRSSKNYKSRASDPVADRDSYIGSDDSTKKKGSFSRFLGNVSAAIFLGIGAYHYIAVPIDNKIHKKPAQTEVAQRDYSSMSEKLWQNNARISQEYAKFQSSKPFENIEQFVPGARIGRISAEGTNGYANLYSVVYSLPYGTINSNDRIEVVTQYTWNGSQYVEADKFLNPSDTEKIAVSLLRAAARPDRNMKEAVNVMEKLYGREFMLNAMVINTVGSEFPMPTEDDYKKYLKVLDQETGKDFSGAYGDRDPRELADALYGNTVNYGLFDSDPRLKALMLLGKGIHDASGGNWKTHLTRMTKAGVGNIPEFRAYHNGQDPNSRELRDALQLRVMTYNPETDRAPEASYPNTTTRWNDSNNGSSGSVTTYHYGESRASGMQRGVQERRDQIRAQQQDNIRRFGNDADNAAAAIQRMMQDQKQINDSKKEREQR